MRNYYRKCPPIIPRKAWGATDCVKGLRPLVHPVQNVVLTFRRPLKNCLKTNSCLRHIKRIQNEAIKEDSLPDIPHNFYIGANLDIIEGRGWDVASDKSLPKNHLQQNKLDFLILEDCIGNKPISDVMNLITRLVHSAVFREILEPRYRVYIIKEREFD